MQLVVNNGLVVATHSDDQQIADRYPGCEIVLGSSELGDLAPSITYRDRRRMAYPPIAEQLDMMYHGTWQDAITAVKAQYPKP
jgi:hypothetical protein